jgi:predicted membrane channel-forming protein YqfA (hemolysin III family)
MSVPVTPLGVIGLIAVIYLVYIFANLSQRLGAVTKMRPYFRFFYLAMALLGVSMLARVVRSNGLLNSPFFYLATYHLPVVIAIVISVGVAWYYWSWLFKEKLA